MAEKSRMLVEYLLEKIQEARTGMRTSFAKIPVEKLQFCPASDGKSIGDLVWETVRSFDLYVSAMSSGTFEEPAAAKPHPATVEEFLAWDEARFPAAFERAKQLSDDDLSKTVQWGPLPIPARDIPFFFLSSLYLNLGGLAVHFQSFDMQRSAEYEAEGTLSDSELDEVSAGTASFLNFNCTMTYTNTPLNPPQTQSDLGSLFKTSDPKINAIMGGIAGAVLAFLPFATAGTGLGMSIAEQILTKALNAGIKVAELH